MNIMNLSYGASRKSVTWRQVAVSWDDFVEKLRLPVRGRETLNEYRRMSKKQQDELKDVGGFVGGQLKNGLRKAGSVVGRDIVTLDLDSLTPDSPAKLYATLEALRCTCAVYSTRKHSPESPRLRVIFPIDRTVTQDEYEPIARMLGSVVGIDSCDPTTFQAVRMMYWPSVCADGEYVYKVFNGVPLSADKVLNRYADWHDVRSWAAPKSAKAVSEKVNKLAADPETKRGVVGAFCRTYDIPAAINAFIPDAYAACEDSNRYTYTGGSTTGGAVVYGDGKFLYSHHATDPCSDQLVNAFDMVRLHLFGDSDDAIPQGTPINRLPSFKKMCAFASEDKDVRLCLAQEQIESAKEDFNVEPLNSPVEGVKKGWEQILSELPRSPQTGKIIESIAVAETILKNDPILSGKIVHNVFTGWTEVRGEVPWCRAGKPKQWCELDMDSLHCYVQKVYGLDKFSYVDAATNIVAAQNHVDDIKDMLESVVWDGTPRLDTLFIDYLGAKDSAYMRAVTRMVFTAAVARTYEPGVKFDDMVVLSGKQGRGKSTVISTMAGRDYFSDTIQKVDGKEGMEQLRGKWIVEFSEMQALSKADSNRIKQFLSQQVDIYRPSYGRTIEHYPRRCVFFGTVNEFEYLKDKTGNRRFYPVEIDQQERTKDFIRDLPAEVPQMWAEAVVRYKEGTKLFLEGDVAAEAFEQQRLHRETGILDMDVENFVEKPVPDDWYTNDRWTLETRRLYWRGEIDTNGMNLVPRDRICVKEVWSELMGGDPMRCGRSDSNEILWALKGLRGWSYVGSLAYFGYCGRQKAFKKNRED